MFTPLDYHFSTTELAQLLRKGHHHVQLDPEAWERLAAWFDLNAPFYGTWGEIPQFTGGYGPHSKAHLDRVHARAMELRRLYVPMGPHPDYEFIPELRPSTPRRSSRQNPKTVMLRPKTVPQASAEPTGSASPASTGGRSTPTPRNPCNQGRCDRWQTRPRHRSRQRRDARVDRIPGGRFLMGSTDGPCDEQPRSIQTVSPFWMARCEISNQQFRQFRPTHESRTEDRLGYQFGVLAYDQDQPDQPAVRVSWLEAMAFCAWLSERTGLQITLPTEAQWEWACRAGTDTPFWFGDADADYSSFANLGDRRLIEFAADTALDNYTAARPMLNPNRYDAWIPRDDRFDDGGFVTEPVGRYQPNPWGLHDLHGNAWEWTRSIERPIPIGMMTVAMNSPIGRARASSAAGPGMIGPIAHLEFPARLSSLATRL
jgi:formylglycine-generating enzyme required for sulfatase activity